MKTTLSTLLARLFTLVAIGVVVLLATVVHTQALPCLLRNETTAQSPTPIAESSAVAAAVSAQAQKLALNLLPERLSAH